MIGLPTKTHSMISSDDTPASAQTFPISTPIASRTALVIAFAPVRIHHHVGDAAHQILAEADLRIGNAGGGERAPREQRGEMAGDGGRADVDGDAAGEIVQPRPERDHHRPAAVVMDGGGHLPLALAQDFLHLREQIEVDPEPFEAPFLGEHAKQPVGVAERLVHVRLVDLDVAELGDRIALDQPRLGALPDDLPVDLHVLRHVDDEVALDGGVAGEAALVLQFPADAHVARFRFGEGRQVILRGGDAVLGELAFLHLDLAAPADAAPAAHALDVDAKRPRRIEHRRAERKPPPPPGGHEEDERVFEGGVHPGRYAGAASPLPKHSETLSPSRFSSARALPRPPPSDAAACGVRMRGFAAHLRRTRRQQCVGA